MKSLKNKNLWVLYKKIGSIKCDGKIKKDDQSIIRKI